MRRRSSRYTFLLTIRASGFRGYLKCDIAYAKPLPGEFKLVMDEQWSEPHNLRRRLHHFSFSHSRPLPSPPTSLHQVLLILHPAQTLTLSFPPTAELHM